MKTKKEILIEFGCPDVPFDENVTMYYPAILSAMEEYANQQVQLANRWIPVEEELPEAKESPYDVLVKDDCDSETSTVTIVPRMNVELQFHFIGVTHWRLIEHK